VLVGDLGNLNSQKGHQYVVEAVGQVRATLPAVTLRVRGGSATGHEAYQQRVEDLARDSGLPANAVRSLEPGMSPARFLSALDVFALGSEPRSEGVPTAIIESMLTGVPTVAARVGGVDEVVRDGETGWCVAPRDVPAMTDRIRQLAADPVLRHRLGKQARAYAAANLSLDNCVQAHRTAYEAARRHAALRTSRA
jgi:glycosyltransferase involved in cell wall biosynthesis